MTRQIPTEVLIQRIRDASVNGLAPSSQELSSTYKQLRKRGVEWSEACVMAGVRQRPKGRPAGRVVENQGWVITPGEVRTWAIDPRWTNPPKPRRRWWQFGRAKAA